MKLKEKTKLLNEVMDSVPTSNISKGNKLLKCGALVVTQLLGMKEIKNKKKEIKNNHQSVKNKCISQRCKSH